MNAAPMDAAFIARMGELLVEDIAIGDVSLAYIRHKATLIFSAARSLR